MRKILTAGMFAAAVLMVASAGAQAQLGPITDGSLDPFNRNNKLGGSIDTTRGPKAGRDYTKIHVSNKSGDTIWVAIRFLPFSDAGNTSKLAEYTGGSGFVTKCWFELKPGQRVYVANSSNRNFYVYAENRGQSRLWAGDNNAEVSRGGTKDTVGFRQVDFGSRMLEEYTYTFLP
jgi:hypothetical protein